MLFDLDMFHSEEDLMLLDLNMKMFTGIKDENFQPNENDSEFFPLCNINMPQYD